jgi:hypothetical protein
MADYDRQVFLNVPFDKRYRKLQDALVFAIHACGLKARCALEGDDGGQIRSNKILGIVRYRYQKFCSDIAGQDIRSHNGNATDALTAVRNWLQASTRSSRRLAGPTRIAEQYVEFRSELPIMCGQRHLSEDELTFLDYKNLVAAWCAEN